MASSRMHFSMASFVAIWVIELAKSVEVIPGNTSVTRRCGPASWRSASLIVRTAVSSPRRRHGRQDLHAGGRDDVDDVARIRAAEDRKRGGDAVEYAAQVSVDHRVSALDAERSRRC